MGIATPPPSVGYSPMSPAPRHHAHLPALVIAVLACLVVAALPASAVQARRESAHVLQRALATATRPILGQWSIRMSQGVHWALLQGPVKR